MRRCSHFLVGNGGLVGVCNPPKISESNKIVEGVLGVKDGVVKRGLGELGGFGAEGVGQSTERDSVAVRKIMAPEL